jgi:hypothetical protein
LEGRITVLIAYAGKDSLQVFRISKKVIQKIGSGKSEELKPFRSIGKKILIVGRETYLHLRKRYPPAALNDLKKAISLEIDGLFPIKNPAHSFRVFERTSSHTLVDIWAWENAFTERIASSVFPFTHVIPEDAAFISQRPEICVETDGGNTYVVASSPDGFTGSILVKGTVNSEQMETFRKSLGRYGDAFKTLVFSGAGNAKMVEDLKTLPFEIVVRQKEYPACIDSVMNTKLTDFALGGAGFVNIIPVAMRGVIYLLIGIAVFFVVTGRNYNASVVEMNKKISKLSGDMAALASGPRQEDLRDVFTELSKKSGEGVNPLSVLNMVAGTLPEKSHVSRIVLSDKNLEMTIVSDDPLDVIKEMGKAEMIKSLKLRGSPVKEQAKGPKSTTDQSKGAYSFTVTVELK